MSIQSAFVRLLTGSSCIPAVSFLVPCETQQEVDYYWDKLTAHGKPVQCGWLEDKYGMWWQIVRCSGRCRTDAAKSQRVMKAMLRMVKLDVAQLERAAAAG